MVKKLPANAEDPGFDPWVRINYAMASLEECIAVHSSTLAWRIPWTEEPGIPSPYGRRESDTTKAT